MVEPSSREYLSASGASFFFALKDFFCVNMLIYENQMLTKHDMKGKQWRKSYANAYYLIASLNDKQEMKKHKQYY